jgi:hypothetical protein
MAALGIDQHRIGEAELFDPRGTLAHLRHECFRALQT